LVGKAVGNQPPQEITVTLASLLAPRLPRGGASSQSQTAGEPYGWESREFLRKLCIGKAVSFRVVYVVSSINRTFADVELVQLPTDIPNPTHSVAKLVVSNGWAAVTPANEGKVSVYHEELVALEAEAKSAKLGMHAPSEGPAKKINSAATPAEIEEIFNKRKGKPTSVIVVRTQLLK
jgi:staphylococcal nuclease domain-containing protein 1